MADSLRVATGQLAAIAPEPTVAGPTEARRRADELRVISYLILFRLSLAAVLLVGAVTFSWTQEGVDALLRPAALFGFGLAALTFLNSLAYTLLMPRIRNLRFFAAFQIGVDLSVIACLVHVTGGGQSAFTFLFLVEVIGMALLPGRLGVLVTAAVSAGLLVGIASLGFLGVIPPLAGQSILPTDIALGDLVLRLILNVAGILAMGALGLNLSGQTLRAGERLTRHQQYAGDLASLHQNTIRSLSSGLVTTTLDGLVTSINEAACEILGISTLTPLGYPLANSVVGLRPMLEEAGPVGAVRRKELDAMRPDGSRRRLGLSMTPLQDHAGQVIGRVIHFQDLTELRRMELRVQRAERLAGIGRLAAGIAHEIRNPLASISGSVEILRTLPGTDPETQQLIDIAVREVDRLNQLITDLLDYARPRTEERAAVDLSSLVADVCKAFRQEHRDNVRITVNLEKGVGVMAAANPLRQIIWNLVRNAAEAMPEGGDMVVTLLQEANAEGRPEAVMQVSDTGVGISREDQERIFEPFFSTKAKGTGLGLATVARLVEDLRGSIEIHSEVGSGTTFTVRWTAISVPERTPTQVTIDPMGAA